MRSIARGQKVLNELPKADYKKSIALGDRYDAVAESRLRRDDFIEMVQSDWLRAYQRLTRNYTLAPWAIPELNQILESSRDMTQCIAIALRLADLEPSADWFKAACRLAQTTTIGQIESGLYEIQERDEFITAVLARVHYDLFNSFEFGDYVVTVELVKRDGKLYRQYTNP
jgi:hypothetical protein